MKNVEVIFQPKEDRLTITVDGEVRLYQECLSSTEILNDFGVDEAEDITNLNKEEVIRVIDCIRSEASDIDLKEAIEKGTKNLKSLKVSDDEGLLVVGID